MSGLAFQDSLAVLTFDDGKANAVSHALIDDVNAATRWRTYWYVTEDADLQ